MSSCEVSEAITMKALVEGFEMRHRNNPHFRGRYGTGEKMLDHPRVRRHALFVWSVIKGNPWLAQPNVVAAIYTSITRYDDKEARAFWRAVAEVNVDPNIMWSGKPARALISFIYAMTSGQIKFSPQWLTIACFIACDAHRRRVSLTFNELREQLAGPASGTGAGLMIH
jgi:hypothetical protein